MSMQKKTYNMKVNKKRDVFTKPLHVKSGFNQKIYIHVLTWSISPKTRYHTNAGVLVKNFILKRA